MKKAVLIFDLDKLTKEEWLNVWDKAGIHIQKIENSSEEKVIQALDEITEADLEAKYI